MKLLNNVFSGNHSERGGAIGLIRANNTNAIHLASLINNSFSRNTAKWGGAIVSNNSNPLILNSIFWGDSAGYGREIYVTANDKVEIANTIIKPSFIAGVLIYGGGILDQDPMFNDTVLLTTEPESPCMNTGKREYTCCNSGESFYACCRDITGQSRPLGGGYEMGAYEYPTPGFPDIQTSLPFDAWPNPFSAIVIFGYTLGESSEVLFSVYDSYGKLVAEPVKAFQHKGEQRIEWNAGNLPAGIYYCRLQTGNITVSRKIIKIK
ncbi:MAG: T9SS type A sorting domain-containing protein [Lentimicrobium sp.]|nr:T9SS type A sorting domain-containing protein [Lentimicrobium sp.]